MCSHINQNFCFVPNCRIRIPLRCVAHLCFLIFIGHLRPAIHHSLSLHRPHPKSLSKGEGLLPTLIFSFTIHQLNLNNETPCPGNKNRIAASPFVVLIHSGEFNNCNWPACSSCLYCLSDTFCGEPICFHAS